ncbi:unnamed protein product [Soboliphyme baturini]|uniref:XPA_C domain-containing protein n=1 Tax=Soboliphyme baturini TaxID=241478 RepID=A0A183J4P3_9BILA|nr:unnamed protein product [Soboliphyme baturini]
MHTRSDKGASARIQPYKTAEELYRACQPSYRKAGGFIEEGSESSSVVEEFQPDYADEGDKPSESGSARLECIDCGKCFSDSFLFNKFGHRCCDACRDRDGEHKLITCSNAKKLYLLKDCDLNSRQPPLRFLLRKNPHSPRGGDMKLYLRLQVSFISCMMVSPVITMRRLNNELSTYGEVLKVFKERLKNVKETEKFVSSVSLKAE